ncbi:hypothetical protein BJ878DRAFT_577073 [Calycina marina]|uniref:Uncharacterized protein n=1 Tax=Calycina marina TaxID=1763456 RepID=A0A9P7YZH9_9HELO|nr:hypothetical protein BJ878DRAFT_577073 [Calycina marina]
MLTKLLLVVTATFTSTSNALSLGRILETYNDSPRWSNDTVVRQNNTTIPDTVDCTTPAMCWQDHRIVGPDEYWIKNAANVKNSSALTDWSEFYTEYLKADDKNEISKCYKLGRGALQCYASLYWGDGDFECRIDQMEKCHVPSAEVVLSNIDKRFPHLNDQEKTDKARAVYFTMKNFETTILNQRSIHNVFELMKNEIVGQKDLLVHTFTPQVDVVQAAKCKFAKDMIRISTMVAIRIAGASTIGAIGPAGEEAGAAAKLVLDNLSLIAGESLVYLTQAEAAAELIAERAAVHQPAENPYDAHADILRLTFSTAGGMCGNNFHVGVDDNKDRADEFTQYVIETLNQVRRTIASNLEAMFRRDPTMPKNPILNLFMSQDQWTISANEADASYNSMEDEARQSITNLVISELLAGSRCYQECEPLDAKFSDGCNGNTPNNNGHPDRINQLSRACYPQDKVRCQMQCITKEKHNNRKNPLPGLEKLSQFGITPRVLMDSSWNAYKQSGPDSYTAVNMVVDGHLKPNATSLHIPVCIGRSGERRIATMSKHDEWNKGMPMACGFRGEDTGRFLDRIGLNITTGVEIEYRHWHLLRTMKHMSPIERYLLLCELNLRFPTRGHRLVKNKRDDMCDAAKIDTWFMTHEEANAYFCNMFDHGHFYEKGKEGEYVHYADMPSSEFLGTLSHRCEEWNKHHKDMARIFKNTQDITKLARILQAKTKANSMKDSLFHHGTWSHHPEN